jgi:hypothetical protein
MLFIGEHCKIDLKNCSCNSKAGEAENKRGEADGEFLR